MAEGKKNQYTCRSLRNAVDYCQQAVKEKSFCFWIHYSLQLFIQAIYYYNFPFVQAIHLDPGQVFWEIGEPRSTNVGPEKLNAPKL